MWIDPWGWVKLKNCREQYRVKRVQPAELLSTECVRKDALEVIMRPVSLKAQPMDNDTQ